MREQQTRHISVGCLIDGSGGPVKRKVAITVDAKGEILAIGRPGDGLPSWQHSTDDLGFATVVPPLVDCSLQLGRSPAVDAPVRSFYEADAEQRRAMVERHLKYCCTHGVLAVADGDDPHGLVAPLRGRPASPNPALVTVRAAGLLVRSWRDWQRISLEEVDFLRLAYGPALAPGSSHASLVRRDSRLSREELFSILAHRGGKKAVVVANGVQAVADVLQAGCDVVEQGYGMGKDNLQRLADQGTLWLPSLVLAKNGLDSSRSGGAVCCRFSQCYAAPGKGDPGAAAYWQRMLAEQSAQVALAARLGVNMAIGTGAGAPGVLHGEAVVEEIKLMRKAGLSLEATIRCASVNGAAFLGLDRLGPLKPGARATFLVVRGGLERP